MRYPHDAHKKELEDANKVLEMERLLVNEIIDGEIDDDE
jgi:26S proteasome regulatory subunit N3